MIDSSYETERRRRCDQFAEDTRNRLREHRLKCCVEAVNNQEIVVENKRLELKAAQEKARKMWAAIEDYDDESDSIVQLRDAGIL